MAGDKREGQKAVLPKWGRTRGSIDPASDSHGWRSGNWFDGVNPFAILKRATDSPRSWRRRLTQMLGRHVQNQGVFDTSPKAQNHIKMTDSQSRYTIFLYVAPYLLRLPPRQIK